MEFPSHRERKTDLRCTTGMHLDSVNKKTLLKQQTGSKKAPPQQSKQQTLPSDWEQQF